jgi:hypothetical protein
VRLFQNFSFGAATLDVKEKRALDRFSQEAVSKFYGFGTASDIDSCGPIL